MRVTFLRIKSSYNLFGIFAIHSPEACPLNNTKKRFLKRSLINCSQTLKNMG